MSTTLNSGEVTDRRPSRSRRLSTETKASFKTTEFMIFIAAVAGVLVTAQLVGSDSVGGDIFRADSAWKLVTALTIGYMISRGLAKSGSRDFYND